MCSGTYTCRNRRISDEPPLCYHEKEVKEPTICKQPVCSDEGNQSAAWSWTILRGFVNASHCLLRGSLPGRGAAGASPRSHPRSSSTATSTSRQPHSTSSSKAGEIATARPLEHEDGLACSPSSTAARFECPEKRVGHAEILNYFFLREVELEVAMAARSPTGSSGLLLSLHRFRNMAGTRFFLQVLSALVAMCLAPARSADWLQGTATPYGASEVAGTIGGACGYGNLLDQGYGVNNAALSMALFSDGASCGQCYLVFCDTSKSDMCKPETAVTVTATNLCPPSYQGGWCNPTLRCRRPPGFTSASTRPDPSSPSSTDRPSAGKQAG